MSLTPLAIALEGIGTSALSVAMDGFAAAVSTTLPPSILKWTDMWALQMMRRHVAEIEAEIDDETVCILTAAIL